MKTNELIELQKSITQWEWYCHNETCVASVGLLEFVAQTADDDMTPEEFEQAQANAQAIALTPQLIAEVIRLRGALEGAVDLLSQSGVRFHICDGGKGNMGEASWYNRVKLAARTALENT